MAARPGATSVEAMVDRAASYMVDGNLTEGARAAIAEHAGRLAAAMAPAGAGSSGSAAVAADIVFLVAATPEYQLS